MAEIPDGVVQTCVTSPPYFGLRDYGTGKWDGGDLGCSHVSGRSRNDHDSRRGRRKDNDGGKFANVETYYRDECGLCGATRTDEQIGLEPTLDAYVERLVRVFREVRRTLRDDGTCWLNLGDSYSSGAGAQIGDCFNSLLEGGGIILADPGSVTVTGHRVNIPTHDELSPDSEFDGLLRSKRDSVKNGDEDLRCILDLFADPTYGCLSGATGAVPMNATGTEASGDRFDHGGVVVANGDSQAKSKLGIRWSARTRSGKDDETSLAIDYSDEPRGKSNVCRHSDWHSFASHARSKGAINIDPVNQPIPFGNGFNSFACLASDFSVRKASKEHISLVSVTSGVRVTIRQPRFLLSNGSLYPLSALYNEAIRKSNRLQAKQCLGVPWVVAQALQDDGWILRCPIVWWKTPCMPESIEDRPTRAHEFIFLLSKSARYYYDAAAIRERLAESSVARLERDVDLQSGSERVIGKTNGTMKAVHRNDDARKSGRHHGKESHATGTRTGTNLSGAYQGVDWEAFGANKRDVWRIAPAQYSEAHFATSRPRFPRSASAQAPSQATSFSTRLRAVARPWRLPRAWATPGWGTS